MDEKLLNALNRLSEEKQPYACCMCGTENGLVWDAPEHERKWICWGCMLTPKSNTTDSLPKEKEVGVGFSHGEAGWSYPGFSDFRQTLASKINIFLSDMDGFGGSASWDTVNDPIVDLLHHSDCDGELTPEQCRLIAPRLGELIALISDAEDPTGYDRENGQLLKEGMELAASLNQPLVFC